MRAYGVDKKDVGCCPGHDKFSPGCYNSRRSERAKRKATRYAHGRERARVRDLLRKEVEL